MENKQPLLSICIPTYNRVDVLKETIESIINSVPFREGKIELVVSDNDSDDGTNELMTSYLNNSALNLIYNRNNENIGAEKNYIKVLSLAKGKFLKLHNDYCPFREAGLNFLVDLIEANQRKRPFISFSMHEPSLTINEFDDFDEYIYHECMSLHWISSIGFWKEDFVNLSDKESLISTLFLQTDWSLRIAKRKCHFLVCNKGIFERIIMNQSQGGYHFIAVFSKYPCLFQPYLEAGYITSRTHTHIKKEIIDNLAFWYYTLNIKKDQRYTYKAKGAFQILIKEFGDKYYFYPILIKRIFVLIVLDVLSFLHIRKCVTRALKKISGEI